MALVYHYKYISIDLYVAKGTYYQLLGHYLNVFFTLIWVGGGNSPHPPPSPAHYPVGFPLITQKR